MNRLLLAICLVLAAVSVHAFSRDNAASPQQNLLHRSPGSAAAEVHVYVTNSTAVDNVGSISACKVSGPEGLLSECQRMAGGFAFPNGIAIDEEIARAYVTNTYNKTVEKCKVAFGGVLEACEDSGATGLSMPHGIAINKQRTYAYVTNLDSGLISRCKIDAKSGSLDCQDSNGTGFTWPHRVELDPSGSHLYVANGSLDNKSNGGISVCDVDVHNGLLSGCHDAGEKGFQEPSGIAFDENGRHAYIVNATAQSISMCSVDPSTGSFLQDSCRDAKAGGLHYPDDIVLSKSGDFAYVTNSSRDYAAPASVSVCLIDRATGLFAANGCSTLWGDFNRPTGIALAGG
jgi:DNA-binding beta-propeller fold protein YncE